MRMVADGVTVRTSGSAPARPARSVPDACHPGGRRAGIDVRRALTISVNTEYPIADVPTPDPAYDPERVVEIQLSALATNDEPFENAGIATAYNFASPANRRVTGPFEPFVAMVRGPQYAPMVDHVEATTGPIERDGDSASQRVTLTGPDGRTETYAFGLSNRRDGTLDDHWLTDRVRQE